METHLWRLADIGKLMRRDWSNQFDVLILMRPADVYYFTGCRVPGAYAMVTKQGEAALGVPATDRGELKAGAAFDYLRTFTDRSSMVDSVASLVKHFQPEGIKSVGIEYSWLPHGLAGLLGAPAVIGEGVRLGDCDALVDSMRAVKDETELGHIRGAAGVADAGMAAAVAALQPGVTELALAAEAECAMRREGAENFHPSRISSGERTATARGLPTTRVIGERELVTIELHPVVDGYTASICRTVCVVRPDAGQEEAFAVLTLAQQETAAMARTGAALAELEGNFYRLLREAGHDQEVFGRPVHGVGIEACEAPFPGGSRQTAADRQDEPEQPLKANTVLAVGNGGLSAGDWGMRLMDTVVAGAGGPELLTTYAHSLTAD